MRMNEPRSRLGPLEVSRLFKEAAVEWNRDGAPMFGAAIAFYTTFYMAPVLIIAIAVAGAVFGEDAAEGRVVRDLARFIGRPGAEAVQNIVSEARPSAASLTASALSVLTMIFGATRAFGGLKTALERMWDVDGGERSFLSQFAFNRLVSFAMVLIVGVLLLALLAAGTALSAVDRFAPDWFPERAIAHFLRAADLLVSAGAAMLLFALIYRYLPEAEIEARDVWLGAFVAAMLFTAGKFAISWYLGRSGLSSLFGAAGSLVAVNVWVYFSAQILLFGAELTQVYARRWGSRRGKAAASA